MLATSDLSSTLNVRIEVYAKLIAFFNKFGASMIAILLDSSSVGANNWTGSSSRGFGYEMASSFASSRLAQGNDVYPLVFTYTARSSRDAQEIEKHMKVVVNYLNIESLDHKAKFFFEQVKLSIIRISLFKSNFLLFFFFL